MALRKIRAWKEIEVGDLVVFFGTRREFLYRVLEKDWPSRSIRVRGRRANGRPHQTRIFSVPDWIRDGTLRRAKGGTKL
jgi:hypothetical protein